MPHHAQGDGILRRAFSSPARPHYAIAKPAAHFWRVRAVLPVHLYAAASGDEAEDIVAIDRMTARRELIVDALEVLVYGEHVVALVGQLLLRTLKVELVGRHYLLVLVLRMVAHLHIFGNNVVGVKFSVGYLLIEIGHHLEPHLLHEMRHDALLSLDVPVLETPLQQFLGIETVLLLCLFQGKPYLRLGLWRHHYRQPVAFWLLVALRYHFHGITGMQLLPH